MAWKYEESLNFFVGLFYITKELPFLSGAGWHGHTPGSQAGVFFLSHTSRMDSFFPGTSQRLCLGQQQSSLFGSCRPLGCSNSCLHSKSQGLGRRTVGLLEMMNGSWKKKEINKLSITWRSMRHIFRNGIDYLSLWWCSKVNLCLCSHPQFLWSLKAVAAWKPCHPPCPRPRVRLGMIWVQSWLTA